MNKRLKQLTLAGAGTGLALPIAFGVVTTSFAQSAGTDQAQTQAQGSGFVQRTGPGGMHRGGRGGFDSSVIAASLGITEEELRSAMQDGKSVADLAGEKGVSLDSIVNALIAEEQTELAQAVTDGKITQEEADQHLADLQTNLPDRLSQVLPARPAGDMGDMGKGGMGKGGKMGGHASSTAIAEALGVTEDELRTAFQDGKSVADVAAEKGVSLDTVISAIVAAESEHLAQHVADGTLTQAEADQRLADLQSALPEKLSQVPSARSEGMGPGRHGRHGGFDQSGQPNDQQQQTPDNSSGTSSSSNVAPLLQSENSDL